MAHILIPYIGPFSPGKEISTIFLAGLENSAGTVRGLFQVGKSFLGGGTTYLLEP